MATDKELEQIIYRDDLAMMEGARVGLVSGQCLVTPYGRPDCSINLAQVDKALLAHHICLHHVSASESEIHLTDSGAQFAYNL